MTVPMTDPQTETDTLDTDPPAPPSEPEPAPAGTPFMQAQADGLTVVAGTPELGATVVMSDGSSVVLSTGFDVATAKDGLA